MMIDYHIHLWPHGERDASVSVAYLASLCERASREGVVELAVTEHFFRFRQAHWLLGRWFEESEDPAPLKRSMARYWYEHVGHDLDAYVATCLKAREEGLPVLVGLELDYYPGQMEKVGEFLAKYPFDVVLGSVHWLSTWRFDDLEDPVSMQYWETVDVQKAFRSYFEAVTELARTRSCDVLAHPDLIKVTGKRADPSLCSDLFDAVIEAAKTNSICLEVNSAGLRKPVGEIYPAPDLLKRARRAGVALTLASDAHRPSDIAFCFKQVREVLIMQGIDRLTRFSGRKPSGEVLVEDEGGGASSTA